MNLKQLEAFVCVADKKSFSKAARKLYLTQPTISAHIASLEKELDARLFIRNTKEVSLSEDGTILHSYAKQMIDLEEQIEACFCGERQSDVRKITIAASTVPAQYILPGILSRFIEKYPKEQFKVIETDSSKVIELIAGGAADIGFSGTVLERKFCKYIPFYKDELIIIMPNTGKYRELMEKEDLSWLKNEPYIMREEGSGTRKEAEKQLKRYGIMWSVSLLWQVWKARRRSNVPWRMVWESPLSPGLRQKRKSGQGKCCGARCRGKEKEETLISYTIRISIFPNRRSVLSGL